MTEEEQTIEKFWKEAEGVVYSDKISQDEDGEEYNYTAKWDMECYLDDRTIQFIESFIKKNCKGAL
jgi:hypothetical protein